MINIDIQGLSYQVPALTLGQLRGGAIDMIKKHDEMATNGDWVGLQFARADIILLAIQRLAPQVTLEMLLSSLDLDNIKAIWDSVLGISGLAPLGEAPAAPAAPPPGT